MRSPVVIVGIALTIACMALEFDRFEPRILRAASDRAYDYLLRYAYVPPATDRIAIVDLDEESLEEYGQWPWPRYLVAELTRRIFEGGASVLAFDIVFAEKDRTSPTHLQAALNEHFDLNSSFTGVPDAVADFDRVLGDSLKGHKTVLSCYMRESVEPVETIDDSVDETYRGLFFTRGQAKANTRLRQAKDLLMSVPELTQAAESSAFFNTIPHPDGIVRETPLAWAFGPNRVYPSLALEATRLYLGIPQIGIEMEDETVGIEAIRLGPHRIPTNHRGEMLVNYRKGSTHPRTGLKVEFPEISAREVLTGRVPVRALQGKIIFLGTSAAGLRDLRATPITEDYAGVKIHATVVDNILSDDFLARPNWMDTFDLAYIGLAGILLTIIIQRQRAASAFVLFAALTIIAVGTSLTLLQKWGLVYTPVTAILSMFCIYSVLTMLDFWQHEKKEKWIRGTFGAMVSDKVLKYMEENTDSLSLSGERTEATMFFSDLVGFSSVSEQLDPQQLSELINRYLTPMTEIILERDGYLDKFIGDAIMAVWGIPTYSPDHALQACHASLEQLERLDMLNVKLREDFGYALRMRIGLNTGEVTAGNMGADRQFQYTVMGDAVNLAARLEPMNKLYGTTILVGEDTLAKVQGAFDTRLVDRVQVAGRQKPVNAYELLARAGELKPETHDALRHYEAALQAHWNDDPEEAQKALSKCLDLKADDGPAMRLQKILRGEDLKAVSKDAVSVKGSGLSDTATRSVA